MIEIILEIIFYIISGLAVVQMLLITGRLPRKIMCLLNEHDWTRLSGISGEYCKDCMKNRTDADALKELSKK